MPRTTLRLTSLETRDTPVAGFTAFGAAAGGLPLVAVFRPDGSALAQFPAFETTFRGGVTAAAAELDGDPNTQELVAGAGPGGGPAVKVYSVDVRTGAVIPRSAFFAFEPTFTGGVRVAAGNVAARADGLDQIVLGAGAGGGPRVRTVDGNGIQVNTPLGDFFAFEPSFRGGVQVAAGELDGNNFDGDELVVTPDEGGGPRVRVIRSDGAVLADYFAFNPVFRGGANVTVVGGRVVPDAFALDPSQRSNTLNTAAASVAQTPTTVSASPVAGGIGGSVTDIAGGVTNINGSTTASVGGATTQSGVTASTGATNLNGQGTGFGGISSPTAATGISNQTTGIGGFGTQAVGGTGFGTQATNTGGVTSAVTAGGLSSVGFTDPARTNGLLAVAPAFSFGPFGDPGLALAAPSLFGPVYVAGVRYAVPV